MPLIYPDLTAAVFWGGALVVRMGWKLGFTGMGDCGMYTKHYPLLESKAIDLTLEEVWKPVVRIE
jgi:hypothetical protein